jgi:tetratricopeptide (TPR) repeat protein
MNETTHRETPSTEDEDREVQRLQKRILYRFLLVFSAPLVIIIALAVMSYQLNTKVKKVELLQDIILREIFYEDGKNYTQVIKGYENLKAHNFSSPRMESRLASLYFERATGNDRALALQTLNAAKQSSTATWEIYQTLCAFYTALNTEHPAGFEAEALQHCEKSIALAPDDHQSRNNAAWIYAHAAPKEVKHMDQALRYAEEAVKLTARKNAEVLDTLAEVYFLKGDTNKALTAIEEAVTLLDKQKYYAARMAKFQSHNGTATEER